MRERLQKLIARSGVCSRRSAESLLTAGRVTVNGVAAHLGDKADAETDVIAIDGTAVAFAEPAVYLMLNKPRGYVTTLSDELGRATAAELVADCGTRVFPVGRLDKDSEGLLLLTSDGEIVNRLLRASGGHEKEYEVEVDKPLTREFMEKMMAGVPILDTVTLPCRLRRTGSRSFNLILVQGLNRQIRRMCEALGYNVQKLRRVRINCIKIGNLQPGQWRELTKDELRGLMDSIRDSTGLPANMEV